MKKGDKVRFNKQGLEEFGEFYFSGIKEFTIEYLERMPFYDIESIKLKEFPQSGPYAMNCFELVDLKVIPKYNRFIELLSSVDERTKGN